MKNKIVTVLLGFALIFSIGLNVYLYYSLATTRGQAEVFSNQVIVADDQINNLNNQISDFEDLQNQVSQLEKQLADSEEQVGILENSLSESEAQIGSLEAVIAESQSTIAELEKQQQEIDEKPVRTPAPEVHTSTPQSVNPMPQGPSIDWNDSSGIGDGSGADGDFGGME